MIFANVTDVVIPEGNVIKIAETIGGRVLWEKKREYSFTVKVSNAVGSHERTYKIRAGA